MPSRATRSATSARPSALWLVAAYPFALFFGAIYTESLYLLAALGAFHHFRRREFVRAGLWGLVIGLTRPNGGLLTVPLALLALSPWLPRAIAGGRDRQSGVLPGARRRLRSRRRPRWPPAATCAIGTLLYSTFIWGMTGNPIAWASGHAAWGRHYTSLAASGGDALPASSGTPGSTSTSRGRRTTC